MTDAAQLAQALGPWLLGAVGVIGLALAGIALRALLRGGRRR